MNKNLIKNNYYNDWTVTLLDARINITELIAMIFESYSYGFEYLLPNKKLKLLLEFCIAINDRDIIISDNLNSWDDLESELKEIKKLFNSVDLSNIAAKESHKLNKSVHFINMILLNPKKFYISTDILAIINDNWKYLYRNKCTYRLLAILIQEHREWRNTTVNRWRLFLIIQKLYINNRKGGRK